MLEIALHNPRQHTQFQHASGTFTLARATDETALWTAVDQGQAARLDALLEIAPDADGVALAMVGCEAECHCGRTCGLTGSCRLPTPASFSIGDTRFEIALADPDRTAARRPLQMLSSDQSDRTRRKSTGRGPSATTLSRWFAALGTLNHWTTSLQELYVHAARCAVEAIGLDGAVVLRRRDGEWEIAASHLPHPELGIHCDLTVLDELLASPQTYFHGKLSTEQSNEPALVVAPLRNSAADIVGAIYGYRSVRTGNARRGIRYLEANLIELLAGAVTDGIARLEREAEVDRHRVLLERAFVATLEQDPTKLIGETREVTLLFADLRGSTELAETLDMNELYELLGQVMDCFTAAVMDHDGLVIDFYGDGLAAMWNAPANQADHPQLACRAALRLLETLPTVAADWAELIQADLQAAVGVHTGMVQVGNAGSTRRMKYGPRGANVNLTKRIEDATKELGLPLLVTHATARRLSNRFAVHRVCRARLPGVAEPIDLYGVASASEDASNIPSWQAYNEGLKRFEDDKLDEAAEIIATIDSSAAQIPARFLVAQIKRELARKNSRRSTDAANSSRGVITLGTK